MHFLPIKSVTRRLYNKRVAVKVRLDKDQLVLEEGSIGVLPEGTQIGKIPDKLKIVTEDGEEIPATGEFYVTTASFNPYHWVVDLF